MRRCLIAVAALAFCAVPAFAQFVYPTELVNKLSIKRVTQWEFGKITTANGDEYLARITVLFENASEMGVVFKDPDFGSELKIEGQPSDKGTAVRQRDDGEVVQVESKFPKDASRSIPLGKVHLPSDADMKVFRSSQSLTLATPKKSLPTELYIAGAVNGKPNLVEYNLVANLGTASLPTADKLLLDVFNTIAGGEQYSIVLSGTTRVGIRSADGKTTVYSPGSVPVDLASKSLLPVITPVKN